MNVIEISNLQKYYGKNVGVERADLSLKKGEILGFIGPNGAGKSTLIRVVMGLLNKTGGSVKIFDQEPSALVNNNIGYMPSEVNLFGELTALKQLLYFSKIRKCDEKRIYELANELDLDLNKKISELSFGNKKKVGIIAALMHQPDIIILDEPTSGLDPLIQKKFFNLLNQEKNRGASIILSSHVLIEIEKVCDRIALIKEGVILFTDTLTNLKKSEYKKVFVSPKIKILLKGLDLITEENNTYIYSYRGDVNILLQELTKYQLSSINIVDLELEEIFMHYYQKEKNND